MAEVLGAVAAAAQLTAACISLIELTKRIKSRSSTLKSYQSQLLQVQSLSDTISRNPLLQTPEIELHTCNITSLLSQHTLKSSPPTRRLSQVLLFLSQERTLLRLFEELERHKATLSLLVNDIQSRALHQIQNDIGAMSTRRDSYEGCQGGPEGEKLKVETIYQSPSLNFPARTTPTSTQGPSTSLVPYHSSEEPLDEHAAAALWSSQASNQSAWTHGSPGSSQPQTKFPHIEEARAWIELCKSSFGAVKLPPRTWMGCEAGENMRQVNGPKFEDGTTVPSTFLSDDPERANFYIACTVSPGGYQTNGPDVPLPDGPEPTMNPRPSDTYLGCRYKKENDDNQANQQVLSSDQVNGPRYRPRASAGATVGHNGVPKQDD